MKEAAGDPAEKAREELADIRRRAQLITEALGRADYETAGAEAAGVSRAAERGLRAAGEIAAGRGWADLIPPGAPAQVRLEAEVMRPDISGALEDARLKAIRHAGGRWSIIRLRPGKKR